MKVCKNAGICGGCFYQGISYEEELREKEKGVRELLEPVIENPLEQQANAYISDASDGHLAEPIIPSPVIDGYRNKMEFSFGDCEKNGPLTLGLHQKGSFFNIIDASDCQLVHPDINLIVKVTKDFFSEREITYYRKKQHTGYLRHLLVRRAVKTGEILIDLVTSTEWEHAKRQQVSEEEFAKRQADLHTWFLNRYSEKTRKKKTEPTADRYNLVKPEEDEDQTIRAWVEALVGLERDGKLEGKFAGILHTKNDDIADAIRDEGTEVLYGQGYFFEEVLGLRFRITPFSFFQTNSLGAEKLYTKVREYAGFESLMKSQNGIQSKKEDGCFDNHETYEAKADRKPVIYDLYSGTGTITQLMSKVAEKAVGVEIVEEAVKAARENAKMNEITNCDFIAGDVLKVIDKGGKLIRENGSYEDAPRPDIIILDPPRNGIHPKALEKIIAYGVDRIIYVACKPSSLARDLGPLQAAGYHVQRYCPVDMFPRTNNCEVVCLLTRRE